MEWELTNPNILELSKLKIRINNRLAPRDSFIKFGINTDYRRIQYLIKNNPLYGNNKDDILYNIAMNYLKKPYCEICYTEDEPQYYIEHIHDENINGYYNKKEFAGTYRAKVCAQCNRLEAEAKKISNKRDRFIYYCSKNQWNDPELQKFQLDNLIKMKYL